MCKNPLLMGLACCLSAGTCAARTVRTAAELAAVNRGERTTATNFVLTATLAREGARESTDSLFVYDESGATSLRYPFDRRTVPLKAGDHLRLTGTIGFDDRGSAVIVAQSCTVVGTDAPVSAVPIHIRDIHAGRIDFRLVRLTATVHDAYVDEIDKSNNFLVLSEDGVEATRRVLNALPETHVLILTTFGTADGIAHALEAGATGAILKNVDITDLVAAIRKAAAGEKIISDEIKRIMKSEPVLQPLSPRQVEILDSIVRGHSNADIAKQLGISYGMVKEHVQALFTKIGAANRVEAVAIALRKHLLKM